MHIDRREAYVEISLTFVFAYVSYLAPEELNSSGIISLFCFFIVLENYGIRSMSKEATEVK